MPGRRHRASHRRRRRYRTRELSPGSAVGWFAAAACLVLAVAGWWPRLVAGRHCDRRALPRWQEETTRAPRRVAAGRRRPCGTLVVDARVGTVRRRARRGRLGRRAAGGLPDHRRTGSQRRLGTPVPVLDLRCDPRRALSGGWRGLRRAGGRAAGDRARSVRRGRWRSRSRSPSRSSRSAGSSCRTGATSWRSRERAPTDPQSRPWPNRPPAPRPVDGVQSADAVLMVRPASFGWNPETHASNAFQRDLPHLAGAAGARARAPSSTPCARNWSPPASRSAASTTRRARCARTRCFRTTGSACMPTARVVLYPMLAPNRRLERRLESIGALAAEQGRCGPAPARPDALRDAAGSFSRAPAAWCSTTRAGWPMPACRRARSREPLAELCAELGYAPCEFTRTRPGGRADLPHQRDARARHGPGRGRRGRDRRRRPRARARTHRRERPPRRSDRRRRNGAFRRQCARTALVAGRTRTRPVGERGCGVRRGETRPHPRLRRPARSSPRSRRSRRSAADRCAACSPKSSCRGCRTERPGAGC